MPESPQTPAESVQNPSESQKGNSVPPKAPSPENPAPESQTEPEAEPDTFDRAYVERLRKEAGDHRVKAKRADELARRLLTSSIASATRGLLADPSDLLQNLANEADLLDDDGYPDAEKIKSQASNLIAAKPHLANRRPTGEVDQGAREETKDVNLADMLRARA